MKENIGSKLLGDAREISSKISSTVSEKVKEIVLAKVRRPVELVKISRIHN